MTKTVRGGQLVTPACPSCGCRLNSNDGRYYHYIGSQEGKDARGCLCKEYKTLFEIKGNQLFSIGWFNYSPNFIEIGEY